MALSLSSFFLVCLCPRFLMGDDRGELSFFLHPDPGSRSTLCCASDFGSRFPLYCALDLGGCSSLGAFVKVAAAPILSRASALDHRFSLCCPLDPGIRSSLNAFVPAAVVLSRASALDCRSRLWCSSPRVENRKEETRQERVTCDRDNEYKIPSH